MANKEKLVFLALRAQEAIEDQPVHKVSLASLVHPDQEEHKERQEILVPLANRVKLVNLATEDLG